jgi:hypothetical protein
MPSGLNKKTDALLLNKKERWGESFGIYTGKSLSAGSGEPAGGLSFCCIFAVAACGCS